MTPKALVHTFEAARRTDLAEGCKSVLLAGYAIHMSQNTDMPDDRFQICPTILGALQSLRGVYVCTGRKTQGGKSAVSNLCRCRRRGGAKLE